MCHCIIYHLCRDTPNEHPPSTKLHFATVHRGRLPRYFLSAVVLAGSLPPPVAFGYVRNNYVMDMSLCHGGVLVENECVCESRRVRVRRVGACRTIVESGREREFVPPQPLVVWG
jgi:hypothetical protein